MTKKLFLLLLLFCSYTIFSQDFISDWDTSQLGTSAANDITIPTNPAFTYDYTIDWGDTSVDNNVTGDITHTYTLPGIYTVSISGDFPSIYFNGGGDRRKIIEILAWGTIQWQTMEDAFEGCENLNFDAIDSPDLSQVTSLKNMFAGCTSFNGIINNWNVSTITDISGIFSGASIFNRPLNNWFNTASVTDMSNAFNGAQLFNEPLDNWQVGLVTNMSRMFRSAAAFNQNINNWDVSQITNMSELFSNASSYSMPLNLWTVDNVEDMSSMLANTSFNSPLNNWQVGNVTNMAGMFRGSPFNQPLNPPNWDVSKVTNMSSMFENATDFNQPLNGWIVDSVTDMSNMFAGSSSSLTAFNQDLDLWNVDNITNMAGMFKSSSFNNASISNWNVANVTNMSKMFERAELFNHPLNWMVSEVTDMSEMFKQAFAFNQPLVWDVSKVTNMEGMFNSATIFDQPLNGWVVSAVITMEAMFNNAPVFNQPLDGWIVSSVNDMTGMFFDALAFNQNLGGWNVSNVTDMTGMLVNSALSQANYDNTLIGWAAQTLTADVEFGALGLTYCDGRDARQELIDNFNWTITGDTINCPFVLCTTILSPTNGDTNVPDNFSLRWEATPGATGYRVSVRSENGPIINIVMDDEDVGDVVAIDFTSNFTPGDVVFVTVVPYNGVGPATGCTEESFTIVPNWVNSPDAFKLIVDTNNASNPLISDINQLRIETDTNFTYDYSIDWGDGEFNHNVTSEIIHTYVTPGIYTISIIGDYPHHFYQSPSGDNNKLINVEQWGTQVWQSMEDTFYSCNQIVYNAPDVPNLSQVTSMSGMCESSAFNGDINNWDVSNVTDMSRTFIGTSIYNQPLDLWDVSSVTNMSDMFLSARAFNQPLNNWEVGNVTTMRRMFDGFNVNMVFNQPLNDWDVSKVTNMTTMFRNNIDFDRPLNNWTVSAVTTMQGMFQNATAFNGDIDDWNVSNVADMSSMFREATSYNRPNNWNVSAVTTMAFMFQDAQSFDQTLNNWDVSNVITMESMFENALLFNELINGWGEKVSQVTNMRAMFKGAETFNQPLLDWNVNSVVTMQSMFENASAFNQPLLDWNVSAVATMASMFQNAIVFDQSLNNWNVSSVTLMNSMFEDAQAFNNPINGWAMNTSSVTRMDAMFKNALAFNQPLNNWNTGEVLTMAEMFSGAAAFNQPIDSWNVSFVTTMESMFQNAIAYNQTMNSWNVASVNTMRQMFGGATAFNELIDNWNVRSVQTMEEMFDGALLYNRTINSWRVSGVANMNRMFRNASAYNESLDRWDIGTVNMQSMFENASALDQSFADWNVSNVTNMSDMLDNTALSLINYDNTLIAWSEQALSAGITLGAQGLTYCDALEERQSMIDTFSWTISDDILGCPIPECTQLISPYDTETDVPVNTNLNWEPVLYAKGYYLTVRVEPGAVILVNNETINDTSYEFISDFAGGETVFVTLTPFNDTGDAVCGDESFVITSTAIPIVPECANLTEPVDGATDVAVNTNLSWTAVNNADGYRITAGTSSGANDVINDIDVNNVTNYDIPTDLAEATTIYVTVTPYNEVGDALMCNEESFTTEIIPIAPACTNLTSPLNNATNVPVDTNISWNAVTGATGYLVVVGNTIGGIQIVNNIDVGNVTTYDLPDDLSGNRTFYVTIIPYNEVGDAVGCIEENFRTETVSTVPSCTSLTTPLDGAINVPVSISQINWNPVANANGYKVTIISPSNTNNITDFDATTGTSVSIANDFDNGETVTVTVVPYNAIGDATGCTSESFTIVSSTPTAPNCSRLIMPANGDSDVPVDTDISWDTITDADGYRLTISASNSTANNIINFNVTSGAFYDVMNDFEEGETVTVTIVPYNTTGDATGCNSESFTIVSSTTPTIPNCTTLNFPLDTATNVPVSTNLNWNATTGADGYRLTVSANSSTTNNLTNFDVTTGTSYNFSNDFDEGETVTVTIVPYNAIGDALGCASESFTIVSGAPTTVPSCTTLTVPLDAATNVAISTNLSWNAIAGADGYRLSVASSSSTTNNLTNFDVTTGTSYNFTNDFDEDETITVTILPYNVIGDATGCTSESFTTIASSMPTVPNCTSLISPANGSSNVNITTSISWEEILNADGYRLSIGTSSGATNILENEDVSILTSYSFQNNLTENTTYYINIIPYNAQGGAIGCTEQSFTTATDGGGGDGNDIDNTLYGFSPNGDGNNDFWEIDGIEANQENIVYIYNRWGDLVFQIEGYDNQSNVFRGIANKKTSMGASNLPNGTYFFSIQVPETHTLKKLRGFVVIKG